MLFRLTLGLSFSTVVTNPTNNKHANRKMWQASGQRRTNEDRLSVQGMSAKEEAGDTDKVHQPGKQEASCYTERQRDRQEEQSRRVELQIRDKSFAEDRKDGREDVERQSVAAKKDPSRPPLKGEERI